MKERKNLNMTDKLKEILFDLFDSYEEAEDIIDALRSLESCKEITEDEYDKIMENYDDWCKEYEHQEKKFYILRELDKFDLINPSDKNVKKYYSILTGLDSKDDIQEEIIQIQDRLLDYERNGRGSENQYHRDLERLNKLKESDVFEIDTMTVAQKKEYLTDHIMDEMLFCNEITQEDCDDFDNNYDKYIEEYIQYKQGENILKDYAIVDLLAEFKEIKNIDKINSFFEKNNWKLLKTKDDYYQLYFGKNVQVDNMYEFGFSYLLDKEATQKSLENFINYRIELENTSNKDSKEMEMDI